MEKNNSGVCFCFGVFRFLTTMLLGVINDEKYCGWVRCLFHVGGLAV